MSKARATTYAAVRDETCARWTPGVPAPLLVVAGAEGVLVDPLVEAARAGSGGVRDAFAIQPGERDATAAHRLLDEWTTPTLFGGPRLIVARDAGKILKARADAFLAVLDGPSPPHTLLMIVAELDGRTRLAKALKAKDALVLLPPLRDSPPPWQAQGASGASELDQWLVEQARGRGLTLPLEAAAELSARLGNEPGRLLQKLEQLGVLEGTRLDADAVRRHVQPSSTQLLARYEDALRRGDAAAALTLLDQMAVAGVHDPFGRLVTGPEMTDAILRGLTQRFARALEVHEQLGPQAPAILARPPWKRSAEESAALDAALGKGGGARVFVERDVRETACAGVALAFDLALSGLRALRDGRGLSLHGLTVKLARALARRDPPVPPARAARAAEGAW